MILKDSIEISTSPEKILDWLLHLEENYRAWHPDHVACSWTAGEPRRVGSVLSIEEYIHGELHKMKFRLTEIGNTRIEYDILFPLSIICPRGSFHANPKNDSCIFVATLTFRWGHLLSILFRKRIEALKTHMREEGENLKRILEE